MPITQRVNVSKVMTRHVIAVREEDIVTKVHDLFEAKKIHHIPVIDEEDNITGIISRTDFERISAGMSIFKLSKKEEYNDALYRSLRAKEIMTKDPECINQNAPLNAAISKFKNNKFRALPVTEGKQIVGIITPYDIILYYSENCSCT